MRASHPTPTTLGVARKKYDDDGRSMAFLDVDQPPTSTLLAAAEAAADAATLKKDAPGLRVDVNDLGVAEAADVVLVVTNWPPVKEEQPSDRDVDQQEPGSIHIEAPLHTGGSSCRVQSCGARRPFGVACA